MSRAVRPITLLVVLFAVLALAMPAQAQEEPVIEPVACAEPGELTMWVWDENWAEIIGDSIEVWKEEYCPTCSTCRRLTSSSTSKTRRF
jgi:hypothetical protein